MKRVKEKQKKDFQTVRWIYGKTKGQRLQMLTLILSNILGALLLVWFALVCKNLVDGAVAAEKDKLILSAVLLFAIILTQILISLITSAVNERLLANLSISFQDGMLAALLKNDYAKIISYHSGELLNRMFSDVGIVVNGAINLLPSAAYLVFRLVGAAAVLIVLSPTFTMLFLLVGVFICVVMMFMRDKLKHLHKEVQEAGGKVRSYLQEAISSLLVVRVFGAESRVQEKAMEYQNEYRQIRRKRWKISLLGSVGFDLIFQMGYFLAMVWGCIGIFYGTLTYGTLTAMLQLVNQIQSPFAGFSGLISQYYTVLASAERMMEIEELPESSVAPIEREQFYENLSAITFRHVDFTYGRAMVLKDICAVIQKGDIISITGISGGGKSTMFLLLMGAYLPSAGEIYFETKDGLHSAGNNVRGLFAYVPQGNYLFSGTLRDNVTFLQKNVPEEQVWDALHFACADEFVRQLPQGLETPLGEKGHGLSEGQMQRIAIARAILSGAPILLLDEATSALDEATEAQLLKNIRMLQDKTCLVVTHRKAALEICNKHLTLEDGKLSEK